ncbi:MAG: trigger factor [Spirochaetaceae bacterium]|nr:trigger factor [Spirochaetaceae bacterium]
MKITKKFEKLPKSAVKLSLTVAKDDVTEAYDKVLSNYAKTLAIPGFRKGHAPKDVLERKFGEPLKAEAMSNIIESALEETLDEKLEADKRPLVYSQPKLEGDEDKLQLKLGEKFEFTVSYDVMPDFKVENYKAYEIEIPKVSIGKEDIDREIEVLRKRNAIVIDKDDAAKAAKGDVLTINYSELDDEGKTLPGSERQDFVFTLGSGENIYKFDDDLIGMKKDQTKTFDKEVDGAKKHLSVTVTALKTEQLPDLDDDFAQDVDEKYKTFADLKASIKKRLEDTLEAQLKNTKINKLLEKLMEAVPVELPESMIRIEQEGRWRNLARQFGTDGESLEKMFRGEGGMTKETTMANWRPEIEKALHSRLIVEKLLDDLKIEASDADIEKAIADDAERTGQPIEDIKKYYEGGQAKDYLKQDIQEKKLFDMLLAENTVKVGKAQKYEDFLKGEAE